MWTQDKIKIDAAITIFCATRVCVCMCTSVQYMLRWAVGCNKILHHLRWPWNQRHLLIRFIQTFFFFFFIRTSIFAKLIFFVPWQGDWFSDIRNNVESFWYQLNIEQYKLDYVLNRADSKTLIIQLCVCVREPLWVRICLMLASKRSITIPITFRQDQK